MKNKIFVLISFLLFFAEYSKSSELQNITDLPVILTPAQKGSSSNYLIFLFSGDGGWKEFDQQLANVFAAKGSPVVAINSLKYFWSYKSPQQTASDTEKLLKKYTAQFKKDKIILIGYSFGADVIPFVYNQLPSDLKKNIDSVAMLSPSAGTDFAIHVSELLNFPTTKRKYNVADEVRRMNLTPVCFFGKDDEHSSLSSYKKICSCYILDGEHHYTIKGIEIIAKTLLP